MPGEQVDVAVALGSNIGDRLNNLRQAVQALEDQALVSGLREAAVYESDPMYLTDQPSFMNSVVAGHTTLEPFELLAALKDLETSLGRQASVRNGPRLIDLDIVLYGHHSISDDVLEVPHPRMHERPFVLQPLADVLPHWTHPVTGDSVNEMWRALAEKTSAEETLSRVADRIR